MKTIILAAGKGTRMRPLTYEMPKPLVPINGQPFMQYLIEAINDAGLNDICIVVGYMQELIRNFCSENAIDATFIEQRDLLGTGHAIKLCESFTNGEDFMVVMGDNLYSPEDITKLKKRARMNYVTGVQNCTPEKFGVLVEENGLLKEIKEKPKEFCGDVINAGLYRFTPEIFEVIRQTKRSLSGEYYLTDAITLLAQQKKVCVHKLKHFWLDLGCCEDVAAAERFLANR